jgi:hypothetical protein
MMAIPDRATVHGFRGSDVNYRWFSSNKVYGDGKNVKQLTLNWEP